jgi:hypothetical protein
VTAGSSLQASAPIAGDAARSAPAAVVASLHPSAHPLDVLAAAANVAISAQVFVLIAASSPSGNHVPKSGWGRSSTAGVPIASSEAGDPLASAPERNGMETSSQPAA